MLFPTLVRANIYTITHDRLEQRNVSSRVETYLDSFAALTREIFFNRRRETSSLRVAIHNVTIATMKTL